MARIPRPILGSPGVGPSAPRLDVELDWDARGFVLGPPGSQEAGLGSKTVVTRGMKEGKFLPVWVGTKTVGTLRFVLGGLLPEEESEWIGRLQGRLRLAKGRLAFMDHEIEVPPGDYAVDVLSCLPAGLDFDFVVTTGVLGTQPQPLGGHFRRTRPGKELPAWLQAGLANGSLSDPGHDDVWAKTPPAKRRSIQRAAGKKRYVDVLVRLSAAPAGLDIPLSPVEATAGGGMWVPRWESRKPLECPLGIECSPLNLDDE